MKKVAVSTYSVTESKSKWSINIGYGKEKLIVKMSKKDCPTYDDFITQIKKLYRIDDAQKMDAQLKDEIDDIMETELLADSYKRGVDWKGYQVYIPVYNKFITIGLPFVVMVKDGTVRISTGDEATEYLNYQNLGLKLTLEEN